ncbi:MAG TPA: darcynin family protein [Candidatus Binatia bacterium]
MPSPLRLIAVVLLQFEPRWLALPREKRREVAAVLTEILSRHPDVAVRWFDADALGHGYTDFVTCEFGDMAAYHFLWEELRDSALFTTPYAHIKGVVLGIERGYEAYESRA